MNGVINLSGRMYPTLLRSTGVGWALGVGRVGSILGPVVGGLLIAAEWGPTEIFTSIVVPGLVAVLALVILNRAHGREQDWDE